MVAPFTGAWIEICFRHRRYLFRSGVAPFTGAWIEIAPLIPDTDEYFRSHPSRVRGLKYANRRRSGGRCRGRTLHGCVD